MGRGIAVFGMNTGAKSARCDVGGRCPHYADKRLHIGTNRLSRNQTIDKERVESGRQVGAMGLW